MLDDVFSGLDASSEDRIFSRLLGRSGLLRDMDATVLLVTHAAHRLSYADQIIAIDGLGSICEQGTWSELVRTKGYVSGLAARHTSESAGETKETVELTKQASQLGTVQVDTVNDLTRSAGDFSIYRYYFGAVGYGSSTLFLVLMAVLAFFLQFPGMFLVHSRLANNS